MFFKVPSLSTPYWVTTTETQQIAKTSERLCGKRSTDVPLISQ
jgi:hypothetical protein